MIAKSYMEEKMSRFKVGDIVRRSRKYAGDYDPDRSFKVEGKIIQLNSNNGHIVEFPNGSKWIEEKNLRLVRKPK